MVRKMIYIEHQNILVLTNAVPNDDYDVLDGNILRPVKASDKMFEGFSSAVPHNYVAIMAVGYLNLMSYDVWRDIVMFHSFVCDDPETYDYSERMINKWWGDSELEFIGKTQLGGRDTAEYGDKKSRDEQVKTWGGIDFDRFPVAVYPTPKELSDTPLTVEEEESMEKYGWASSDVKPEYEVLVSYRNAFKVFRSLKSSDKKLFDQIRLYVFAKSIRESREVYRNDNCSVAMYISILESLAGRPEYCAEKPKCKKCGKILPHVSESIDKHLVEIYGEGFKSLRKIRNKFFHESEYLDIVDVLYEGYDKRGENTEKFKNIAEKIADFDEEIEWLDKITRKSLIEAFMNRCKVSNINQT